MQDKLDLLGGSSHDLDTCLTMVIPFRPLRMGQRGTPSKLAELYLGGGFKYFLFSPPTWGRFPI